MKISELSEAELACLEYYEEESKHSESSVLSVFKLGQRISEQLEPEIKKIDISKFVASAVLMEFWDYRGGNMSLGHLKALKNNACLCDMMPLSLIWFENCRPKLNHVNAWLGGECPLPDGLIVKFYLRSGEILKSKVDNTIMWGNTGNSGNIIAFEIIGLADGWEW